jgi:hypothetical protein
MIPLEILKKIRQIEIRTNRVVTGFAAGARASARFIARTTTASNTDLPLGSLRTLKRRERRAPAAPERDRVRIPTGFRLKAQGCAPGATLGHLPANIINRNAVAAIPSSSVARDVCHNPVGVGDDLIPFTQGSSFLATLGWRTQSLWDCPNRQKAELQTVSVTRCCSRITHHASRHP